MNKNKNFLHSLKLPAKILQVNVKILKLKPIKMPKKFLKKYVLLNSLASSDHIKL